MMPPIFWLLLRQSLKTASQNIMGVVFGIILVALFPLTIGLEKDLISTIAPSILWVGLTLSAVLMLPNIYSFLGNGLADYYLRSQTPFPILCLFHIITHWLLTALPLLIITPLLLMMLHAPTTLWGVIFAGLIPGSILFSLLGSLIAALSLTSQKGMLLNAVMILPLFLPVMILGASGAYIVEIGYNPIATYLWLWGLVSLMLPIAPWVSAKILETGLKR